MAAEQGDSEAQKNIGIMFLDGLGVEKNRKKAKEWFSKASENGNRQATLFLKEMHRCGLYSRHTQQRHLIQRYLLGEFSFL
ncbi:MAG: hypothetical protein LBR91_03215 [Puniceicoccales bacterium]|jgi:TPR repeat protein|nr:hypothetical protein [Puniceicoccales bacterium]